MKKQNEFEYYDPFQHPILYRPWHNKKGQFILLLGLGFFILTFI